MSHATRSTAFPHPAAELHRLVEKLLHPAARDTGELALGADEAKSIHVGARPMSVEVLEGELLVTCEGDLEDHIVRAGERFIASRRGHHVLAAFVPSRIRIR